MSALLSHVEFLYTLNHGQFAKAHAALDAGQPVDDRPGTSSTVVGAALQCSEGTSEERCRLLARVLDAGATVHVDAWADSTLYEWVRRLPKNNEADDHPAATLALLMAHGACPEQQPHEMPSFLTRALMAAMTLCPMGLVPLLDYATEETLRQNDTNGFTLLHWAAVRTDGDDDWAHRWQPVLARGASLTAVNAQGQTPLQVLEDLVRMAPDHQLGTLGVVERIRAVQDQRGLVQTLEPMPAARARPRL